MSAPSKDDVYAELRRQGIRAIRVDERIAPVVRKGLRGLRKRDWSIIAAVALALISLAVLLAQRRSGVPPLQEHGSPAQRGSAAPGASVKLTRRAVVESDIAQLPLGDRLATARPRHYFDLPTNALGTVFRHPSETWLARFARPGVAVADAAPPDGFADDLLDALDDPVVILADDPKHVAELKRIVTGIKDEAKLALGSGKSAADFASYVAERQRMEHDWRSAMIEKCRAGKMSQETASKQILSMGMKGIDK